MDKEWVDRKNKEYAERMENMKKQLLKDCEEKPFIEASSYFNLKHDLENDEYICNLLFYTDCSEDAAVWANQYDIGEYCNCFYWSKRYYGAEEFKTPYTRYLDSEPKEFDGDIIITDPCYVMKEGKGLTGDDWSVCEYGSNMYTLGFGNFMTRDTIYGDWSCTTYNTDTTEAIGNFCADAGLVSVMLLEEILNYNPDYDDHINSKYSTTLIENFKGTVQFVVKQIPIDKQIGISCFDYQLEVVGHGINKVTGEPINFVGTQTGL